MKDIFIYKRTLIFLYIFGILSPFTYAFASNILPSHKYAWSDNVGYINFEGVEVENDILSGSAWSTNKGFIKFNPAQGGVLNDGTGNLSGSAWGEQLGWIDFDNVSIDGNGKFSGTATGDLVGTITFDCPNYCDVETEWRQAGAPGTGPDSDSDSSSNSKIVGRRLKTETSTPLNLNDIIFQNTPVNIPNFGFFTAVGTPKTTLLPDTGEEASVIGATEDSSLFDIVSEPTEVKVAPGELLPVSVKLSNSSAGQRVYVFITYSIITEAGEEIYSTSETVAVETTANFIKTIQIPFGTKPGRYTAKTSILYGGQLVPALAEFPFMVERRILGLFESEFFLYGGIAIVLGILLLGLRLAFINRRRKNK